MDHQQLLKECFGTTGGLRKLVEGSSNAGLDNVCNVGGFLVPFFRNRLGRCCWWGRDGAWRIEWRRGRDVGTKPGNCMQRIRPGN